MSNVPVPVPAPQASMNSISRAANVFFAPRETFADIVRRPTWLVPVILLCLVSVATTAVFGQRVGWRTFMEKQFADNKQIQQMTPEERGKMVEGSLKWASVTGYVFSVVGPFAQALIVAGVLLGIFNLMAGTRFQFKTALGIVSYSYMPQFILALLGILVIFLKPPDAIDFKNLVASNLGVLVPNDAAKWLQALASSFDLFSFWIMFLMALGFSVANPKKLPLGKSLAFVAGVWAVVVLIKVGWTAAFS